MGRPGSAGPPTGSHRAGGADGPGRPGRRSRSAVAALVLGVLAIPLVLAPYLGALAGLLAVGCSLAGLVSTRRGRAAGRGMAVAGLVSGLVGMLAAAWLYAYGMRTIQDCQDRIGHRPTRAELRECARSDG
jgi:hypothetical protein